MPLAEASGSRQVTAWGSLRHRLRVLAVIATAEFKLKYTGSALGYLWSVLKPLALFTLLYLVFGRVFNLNELSPYYSVSLLVGIVLFTFFADATMLGLISIVVRDTLIRKISFPRVIITASVTLTAGMTLLINAGVVAGFLAYKRITPQLDWLLIPLLLLELYVFTLGVSLLLAALFVRLRDLQQVWELSLQLLFYASPIIYPIGYLPPWAQNLVFLNPFTQVLQDIRALLFYPDVADNRITAASAFGGLGRIVPVGIAIGIFVFGYVYFRRQEPWFAERA
ncbi:MAG: ABC transporter permease [Thermoleophilia bacterium]